MEPAWPEKITKPENIKKNKLWMQEESVAGGECFAPVLSWKGLPSLAQWEPASPLRPLKWLIAEQ